MIAVSFCVQTT